MSIVWLDLSPRHKFNFSSLALSSLEFKASRRASENEEEWEARCGDLSQPAASRLHAAEYRQQSRQWVTHPFGNYSLALLANPTEAQAPLFRSFRSVPLGSPPRSLYHSTFARLGLVLNSYPASRDASIPANRKETARFIPFRGMKCKMFQVSLAKDLVKLLFQRKYSSSFKP